MKKSAPTAYNIIEITYPGVNNEVPRGVATSGSINMLQQDGEPHVFETSPDCHRGTLISNSLCSICKARKIIVFAPHLLNIY